MHGWVTIAKWEFIRSKQRFDRKSLILLFILLILLTAASYAAVRTGLNMNNDIYQVAVTDPDLVSIIETDQRFEVRIVDKYTARNIGDKADVVIIGTNVYGSGTRKSAAAIEALKIALINYRESVLISFNDINNTHPVWLTIHYLERQENFQVLRTQSGTPATSEGSGSQDSDPDAIDVLEARADETVPTTITDLQPKSNGKLFNEQEFATPTTFNPPIPFTSILYSFIFVFPIYFISQFYSSSIMDERTNRKCQLVLVAPLRGMDIVIGKTVPYLLVTMGILGVVTLFIKGLPLDLEMLKNSLLILAVLFPIVLLFFALSFFSAILSRSFKELTFATVFLTVIVSGYLFFPAVFANVHVVSSISPMTLIVHLIEENTIELNEYIFSTLPFYFVAVSVYVFGTYIFREEDLFTQKPITEKILDCIELYLIGPFGSVFLLSIILIPFVFMAQLMLIVMLFNLPFPFSVFTMIFLSALIEEIVKSIGIFTLMKKGLVPINVRSALMLAVFAGAGFFVGEKLLLIITLAPIATSVFGLVMNMGALLLIPLIIHIAGVMIISLGLYNRGVKYYIPLVVLAGIIHSLYNIFILRGVLFG